QATFLGSPEFLRQHGGTVDGFLAALYQQVLGRPLDPSGAQHWGQALARGASRTDVAAGVLASREARTIVVQGPYQALLHRAADAGGRQGQRTGLGGGPPVEAIVAAIAGSREYAVKAAGGNAIQLYVGQLFNDLLQHPADAARLDSFTAALENGTATRGQIVR